MYKGWATKISPCTATFEDLLCFSLLDTYQHFLGVYCSHLLDTKRRSMSSKPLLSIYQTTRPLIPQNNNLHVQFSNKAGNMLKITSLWWFSCWLFHYAFSIYYTVSDERTPNEYWIRKNLEGSGCSLMSYYTGICIEGLRKTTNKLRMVDISAEIRNRHFLNTSGKYYSLSQHESIFVFYSSRFSTTASATEFS
jgi:hypothetical protein